MQKHKILLVATFILISSFAFTSYFSNSANAIPPELFHENYIFGPVVGLSENKTGEIDWIMTGEWRSSLSNDVDSHNNITSDAFNAEIEMIKPDGTARHGHTLTDFIVTNITNPDSNSTLYNGTSTISLRDGPAVDIPTTIQKSNDNSVFKIKVDPESVNYHFGELPMYGIKAIR